MGKISDYVHSPDLIRARKIIDKALAKVELDVMWKVTFKPIQSDDETVLINEYEEEDNHHQNRVDEMPEEPSYRACKSPLDLPENHLYEYMTI